MDDLPGTVTELAATFSFPAPDNPSDPESSFTLTIQKARQFGALLDALIDHIKVQYAKCGKQETP